MIVPFAGMNSSQTIVDDERNQAASGRAAPYAIQYFPTNNLTGSLALVNQSAASIPGPQAIPFGATVDGFGISSSEYVGSTATTRGQNWWTIDTPEFVDHGKNANGQLVMNGGASLTNHGHNYGGISLDGNQGTNLTSSNCQTHTANQNSGQGFAGWFKPTSLTGELYSRTVQRTDAYGGYDGIKVSLNASGWIQVNYYQAAQNDSDYRAAYTFDNTHSMSIQVDVNEWNYISTSHYSSGWALYTRVYVKNATSHATSSIPALSFSPNDGGPAPHTKHMQTWGQSPCVYGEQFSGTIDELRQFFNDNPMENSQVQGNWQTDGALPLPPGLTFDYTSGAVAGIPTGPWDAKDYLVTAISGEDSVNTTLSLEVVQPEMPETNYTGADQFFLTAGDPESIQPPTNSGGDEAWYRLRGNQPNYTGEMDVFKNSACALVEGGKLYCWGLNSGQTLDSSKPTNFVIDHPMPHSITAGLNLSFTEVEMGSYSGHSSMCAIATNGSLWCWGNDGNMGFMGDGKQNAAYRAPKQISLAPRSFSETYPNGFSASSTSAATGCNYKVPSNHVYEDFETGSTFTWNEEPGSHGNWSFYDSASDTTEDWNGAGRLLGSASSNLGSWNTSAPYTIDANERSSLKFDINSGEGLLRLCIRVNTQYQDQATISVDSHTTITLSGENNGFKQVQIPVSSGNHTIHIQYIKNSDSTHSWSDRVYVDKLSYPMSNPQNSTPWTEPTVEKISMADDVGHACLIADGQVYCMGYNNHGQLGVGDGDYRYYPTAINADSSLNFVDVQVRDTRTCALTDTGDMYCWGYSSHGIGHNLTTYEEAWFGPLTSYSQTSGYVTVPVKVAFKPSVDLTVTNFELGGQSTCVIAEDANDGNNLNELYCWGSQYAYGVYANSNSYSTTLADNIQYPWTPNSYIPSSAEPVDLFKPYSGSNSKICILYSNNQVQCSGYMHYAQHSNHATQYSGVGLPWESVGAFTNTAPHNITGIFANDEQHTTYCVFLEDINEPYCGGLSSNHKTGRVDHSSHNRYLAPVDPDPPGWDDEVLPAGMSFNTTSGVISGTPLNKLTTPSKLTIQTCNGRGCTDTRLQISVWDRPEVGQISITSEYMDYTHELGYPAVYKGRPVNLSIAVSSERPIANYQWSIHHTNGLWYNNTLPNSPVLTTTQLPVGVQIIYFEAIDDIGGASLGGTGWAIINVIESDDDGDQVLRWNDNCPNENALGYDDYTGNGTSNPVSDGCIDNRDNDQFYDPNDSCPNENAPLEWDLFIGEGTGTPGSDGCLDDSDRDTITDNMDQCPSTPFGERIYVNPQGCGPSERDTDSDGYKDNVDNCENTPVGESVDEYGCGESQVDSDGDNVYDNVDICPESPPGATVDIDGCSAAEKDSDGDEVNDEVDVCDTTPANMTSAVNLVGCAPGDVVTDDNDQDGYADIFDQCPLTPLGDVVDYNGCGDSQKDSDNDMITDNLDACPGTPGYDIPTVNSEGCGSTQRDSDQDGVIDSVDQCLNTPTSVEVDLLGCQAGLSDSDLDGVPDIMDACVGTDPTAERIDLNGCADSQKDSDGDGYTDDIDQCPYTPPGEPVETADPDKLGCALNDTITEIKALDDDFDGVANDYDLCPGTNMTLGVVIDNKGCVVEIDTKSSDISMTSILVFLIIILLALLLIGLAVMRRRQSPDMWGQSMGDALFDSIDTDGDGIISDEEWESYKKIRDSLESGAIAVGEMPSFDDTSDDDLFD